MRDAATWDKKAVLVRSLAVTLLSVGINPPATAVATTCAEVIESKGQLLERQWIQHGSTTVRIELPPTNARDMLIRVAEQGIDVELEIQDRDGASITRADSPVERHASQHVYVLAIEKRPILLIVKAKEPAQVSGTVTVVISALPHSSTPKDTSGCESALKSWAAADSAYATGRTVALAHSITSGVSARELFDSAASEYRAALQVLPIGTSIHEKAALELAEAAVLYYQLQDWRGTAEWAKRAAVTFARSGDPYMHSCAQALLAAAWIEMPAHFAPASRRIARSGNFRSILDSARALLSQLAAFHAHRRERYDRSLQINNIGLTYLYEGHFTAANSKFAEAAADFLELGESARAATAWQNQALSEWGLSHLSIAIALFDKALALLRPTLYPDLYLLTLNNSGYAHYEAGQFDEALRLHSEALDYATRTQSDRARAHSFFGMGVTYYAIGDRALAIHFLQSALEICTNELDSRMRIAALRAIAAVEHENGDLAEAIAHNTEALSLATVPSARARIIVRLAHDYAAHGERQSAIDLLLDPISHPPAGDQLVQAMALVERGAILRAAGHLNESERDLVKGLHTLRKFDALENRFEGEVELARLRVDQHRPTEALLEVRRALGMSGEIRAQTANPEYRTSIAESLRPALDLQVDLERAQYDRFVLRRDLRAANRVALETLQAVDASRAVAFEEWRAERLESQSDTHVQTLLRSSAALYHEIAERRFRLAVREDDHGPEDPKAIALRADIARLRTNVGLVNAEVAARTSNVPSRRPYAKEHWVSGLPTDRAFVEYWLGSSNAFAWVLTRQGLSWLRLAPTMALDRAARNLHTSMRSLNTVSLVDRLNACAEMYRLVLSPIVSQIASSSTVVFIPDGALHYVSFAALRDETSRSVPFLVQSHVLSIAPALRFFRSSDALAASSRSSAEGTRLLIVADPVYTSDDARLTHRSAPASSSVNDRSWFREAADTTHLTRLTSTALEAAHIRELYDSNDVDVLEGVSATRDNLLSRNLVNYRFIHIASHGIVDAAIPQLSALILGKYSSQGAVDDPYIRASDLLAKTFTADAIVLSACDTALGKQYSSEGVIGLRYAALARGAHAVVASLWPVSDGISAELMTEMYREMNVTTATLGASKSVAWSLATAMRVLLRQTPSLDPALWAPFTVYVAGS